MTISDSPWHHPEPWRSRLRLEVVPLHLVHALAADEADPIGLHFLSPYLKGPQCRGLWRMRSEQVQQTPTDAPWITRWMVDPLRQAPVGLAGFHGAPNPAGMVEVGYRVDPASRRRGYARSALETLLAVAQHHPDVRIVRATISPDNHASRALIDDYGFVEAGEQWDDEDGREIIYEASASAAPP